MVSMPLLLLSLGGFNLLAGLTLTKNQAGRLGFFVLSIPCKYWFVTICG